MALTRPQTITKLIKINKYSRPGTKRTKTTKIAWHYTGMREVPAINTVNYFHNLANGIKGANGKYTYASSHYVVGLNGELYHIVPENEIAYTTNQANSYSIGIECATTGKSDRYTEAEYDTMVKLGAYLADKYNLDPREDFIRHYDVTGKICPRYFVNNPRRWDKFKNDCYEYMIANKNTPQKQQQLFVQVLVDSLNGHTSPDFKASSVCCELEKGTALTVIDTVDVPGSNTKMYKTKSGIYITANTKYVRTFYR